MTPPSQRDAAFSYLSSCPYCLVALDPTTLRPVQANGTFVELMGPLFKFSGYAFSGAATEGEEHGGRLAAAIEGVVNGTANDKVTLRDVEMVTLAGEAGMPVRKHFDWTVSLGPDSAILLFGERCTAAALGQREKDRELIDFFQNAPIALHWLNSEGCVLWANKTEMDVLGYEPEEYIGQPIMNFCPDERELVLEIFQQLGSGNTIRDVPVRFRAKDGKMVHLLIDSNVKYDAEGNFEHTRCFIRDDTGRKIREARARLLLQETKRTLAMLDNFMSRSMHHMKTALHVLRGMCDCVSANLYARINGGSTSPEDMMNIGLLQDCTDHISSVDTMVRDITDLERFDNGKEYPLKITQLDLKAFGLTVLAKIPDAPENVEVAFELAGGGPAIVRSDEAVLARILGRLLENSVEATREGSVALRVGYAGGRCTFSVADSGPGVGRAGAAGGGDGNLPAIFQRYHQQVIPEELSDVGEATDLRREIERGLTSHRSNGLGIGLATSYHLVQALGGDLRYSSRAGETVFWFSLPAGASSAITPALDTRRIVRGDVPEADARMTDASVSDLSEDDSGASLRQAAGGRRATARAKPPETSLKSGSAFNVLVVEDTNAAAKLLCMMLKKLGCASRRAEHGKQALEMLADPALPAPDLVLMDLRMPVMDGLECTRIIKGELRHLRVPVIALTAESSAEIRQQCEDIGFDGFQTKPLKRALLKDLVEKYKSAIAYVGTGGEIPKAVGPTCVDLKAERSISKPKKRKQDPPPLQLEVATPKKMIAAQGLKALDNLSVLVVEDTDTAAKLITRMLTKLNCSSSRAENGKRAVEILKQAMPGLYSVILMDLGMPVMDGLEATRIIKEELKLDIPIIAVTGEGGAEAKMKCEKLGFDGFCTKPLMLPELDSLIHKYQMTCA